MKDPNQAKYNLLINKDEVVDLKNLDYFIIEEVRFIYSRYGKTIKKQTRTNKNQRKNEVEVLKVLKPAEQQELRSFENIFLKEKRNNEIKKIIESNQNK